MINEMNVTELSEEIIHGRGYVLLPDLISPQEAESARNLVLELAATEREGNKDRATARIYGLIYQGDIFEKLVQHPTVLSVIEAILGQNIILGGFSAHVLYPHAPRMGVHVDYPYWAMSAPFPQYPILEVQLIWLVEDFTETNGAPLFAAGTQKLATTPDREQFERTATKITGKAGTAIISHGLCWHDTSVNQSDRPRVSLLGNYTPQYIHPLENNLYHYRPEVIDRASGKLKQLLRHDFRTKQQRIFEMKFKMSDNFNKNA
jgi:ectoine hydroxylase-related dioxygenase (phytanoyl-CoA dioxygenase family)